MPKKVLSLVNFSGGLNNNTNARDLQENEFQVLTGLSVETPGMLKVMGAVIDLPGHNTSEEFASAINHGNGLLHFNSDRDPNDGALSNTEMLLINDVTNTKVKLYDLTDGAYESGSEIDYGSVTALVEYYVVNGEVRVSPHSYTAGSTANQNKWYGYINKAFNYGDGDANPLNIKVVTGFKVENQYLAPNKGDGYATPDGYGYNIDGILPTLFAGAFESDLLFNPFTGSTGGTLGFGAWTLLGNTLTPNGTDKLAQVVTAIGGHEDYATGYGSLAFWAWLDPATDVDDDTGANIYAYTGTSKKRIAIFASNIYGDQESNAVHMGYIYQPTVASDTKKTFNYSFMGRLPNKSRQTGINIYWAMTDYTSTVQAEPDQKYLLFEVDFEKGYRIGGKDNFMAFSHTTTDNGGLLTGSGDNDKYMYQVGGSFAAAQYIAGMQNLQELPDLEAYDNKHLNVMGRAGTRFKTSTILNRRAYIGNITYYDKDNKLQTANDTILKSLVNQFDHFDRETRLDVEINDGDDIIRIASVGSKLLEFKRKTLYIINCSRDIEELEASLHYKGCERDYHVIEAEGFIAWFNQYGVYLYDGESLRDLLIGENGQRRIANWQSTYFSNDAQIGYVPEKQTLIITNPAVGALNNNPSGGVLELDLKSLGWSYGSHKASTNQVSNYINLNDGKLTWYEKVGSNQELRYWKPSPSLRQDTSTTAMNLKTPAYTFDSPNQDKSIKTIYISYKNGSGVTVKGFTDTTSDGSAFTAVTIGTLSGTSDVGYKTLKVKIRDVGAAYTAFKNIKSFGLEFIGTDFSQTGFEVNDIQIVYRVKSVK